MKLLKAYQYFFYRLYRFYQTGPNDNRWWSDWKAYVSILVLGIWLFNAIRIIYHYFFDIPMTSGSNISLYLMIIVGILITILNWALFVRHDKWKFIVEKFDKLPKQRNNVGGVIVWTIIILIIVFYWFIAIPLLGELTYE